MPDLLEKIDVILLCGGRGERLRPVIKDRSKVLAEVGGKAFLDIIIENLLQYGLKRIILSVGYLKEQIISHFESHPNYKLEFSEEETPLGTGGAVKKAESLVKSSPFFVINGDSICKVDLRNFIDFHREKKALVSMVLTHSETAQDYGNVTIDNSQRITGFSEKIAGGDDSLINAGAYLMQRDIFSYMPDRQSFSLEYDFFPKIIEEKCYGFLSKNELIDIGTPERYEIAKQVLLKNFETIYSLGRKTSKCKKVF